jgi:ABC-2 type transport system ATP-binding protein
VEQILSSVATETPRCELDTSRVSVAADGGADQLTVVVRLLDERGITVDDVGLRRPSLDEVFLTLTGRGVAATAADHGDPTADAA